MQNDVTSHTAELERILQKKLDTQKSSDIPSTSVQKTIVSSDEESDAEEDVRDFEGRTHTSKGYEVK